MSGPEATVTKRVMAKLKAYGGFWFKVHGGPSQMAGIPDILGCYQGHFYGIEMKAPGKENNVSPKQKFVMDRIRAAGGTVGVASSWEDVEAILREGTAKSI